MQHSPAKLVQLELRTIFTPPSLVCFSVLCKLYFVENVILCSQYSMPRSGVFNNQADLLKRSSPS